MLCQLIPRVTRGFSQPLNQDNPLLIISQSKLGVGAGERERGGKNREIEGKRMKKIEVTETGHQLIDSEKNIAERFSEATKRKKKMWGEGWAQILERRMDIFQTNNQPAKEKATHHITIVCDSSAMVQK